MNIFLWVLQALLAFAFLMVGFVKLSKPKEELLERMAWVEDFSPNQLKAIGLLEVLGGLGIILPSLTGILTFLTPLAGVGFVLIMSGAMFTHIRRKEPIIPNVILMVLAGVVAYGRLFLV